MTTPTAMRIAQIVPSLEARYGGPSRSVLALSGALARSGHDVELLATNPDAGEERLDGPLRIRIFRRDWPQGVCPSAGLRTALYAGSAEIIHHHSIWLRTLHYAHRQARKSGAQFVLSPRGMMSAWAWRHHGWRKRLARALVHPGAFEAVNGWHVTSDEEADEVRALGFKQPVCVAPNGVNASTATELERAAAYWRTACPAVVQRPVALFFSRFHEKKRIIELIDLWLDQAPHDWLLLVVGIPQSYTVAQLADYVHRASGSDRVQVFDGTDVPPPYAVSSLFLLPSHSENFGLVVAEALANGVPAVVTDTTPWRSMSLAGLGWCVPWSGFGEAMKSALAEKPEGLAALGERARAWVLAEYSWEKSARLLTGFYSSLGR